MRIVGASRPILVRRPGWPHRSRPVSNSEQVHAGRPDFGSRPQCRGTMANDCPICGTILKTYRLEIHLEPQVNIGGRAGVGLIQVIGQALVPRKPDELVVERVQARA
jgi:hypothetical protein